MSLIAHSERNIENAAGTLIVMSLLRKFEVYGRCVLKYVKWPGNIIGALPHSAIIRAAIAPLKLTGP